MGQGLVVLGTVGLDTIRVPGGVRRDILGGSAAHFAMSARLFTRVHLAAVVGADFPLRYLRFFQNRGILTASLRTEPGCTFRWEGEYSAADLNTACTLGTRLGVIEGCTPRLSPVERTLKHIFLANYDPDVQADVLRQMKNPAFVGMDTMNLWINSKLPSVRRLLKKTHILFLNDAEARALAGEINILKAAEKLSRMGPRIVMIKKGEHGSLLLYRKIITALPAFPVRRVLDPTGAGDTFAGGVMGYLNSCRKITARSLQRALAYGTLCSSVNVEGYGLEKTSRLTRSLVFLRRQRLSTFFPF